MTTLTKHIIVSVILLAWFSLFIIFGEEFARFIVYLIGCYAVGQWIFTASQYLVDKFWRD